MGEKGKIISNPYLSLFSTPKKDSEFNVYDDIKKKLVAKGVPDVEVAYIHEADTEAKKKAMFAKVRTGAIRIELGSTAKMGAGTNVRASVRIA